MAGQAHHGAGSTDGAIMEAVVRVNRYRHAPAGRQPPAEELDQEAEVQVDPQENQPEENQSETCLEEEEEEDAVELETYQEILEAFSSDEECMEAEADVEEVEDDAGEEAEAEEDVAEAAEEDAEEGSVDARTTTEAVPETLDSISVEAGPTPADTAPEVDEELSDSEEEPEIDLEEYEISDEDDQDDQDDQELVDISDVEEDDFDDFDGEDFEEDMDLEDYEEDDLGALKQGFTTWLACWDKGLPKQLAQPQAAAALRERLLRALRQATGKEALDASSFSLQWEHALVFEDCPPLLGFISKKDAQAILEFDELKELQLELAWCEEEKWIKGHEPVLKPRAEPQSAQPVPPRASRGSLYLLESLDARIGGRHVKEPAFKGPKEVPRERSRSRTKPRVRLLPDPNRARLLQEDSFQRQLKEGSPRSRLWDHADRGSRARLVRVDRRSDINCFPQELPKVAFDQDGVLVVYKPAFWTMTTCVEGVMSHRHTALQDWIRDNLGRRYPWLHQNERAGLIHRLDVQTSGPIIAGGHPKAFKQLRESLHVHKFYKEYIALMHGALPIRSCCGEMDYPLLTTRERGYAGWRTVVDPSGQQALTKYEAVAAYKLILGHGRTQRYTLVRLQLITGKTHQIRVHLMELARRENLKTHGIVGDYKYLPPRSVKLDKRLCRRVFLHCYRLHFPLPDTKEEMCKIRCPLPLELTQALDQVVLDRSLTERYKARCRQCRVMQPDKYIEQSRNCLNIPGLVDYDEVRMPRR
ncbi:unnamed protein product [Effrenium voratum]|nr:unnamed protein product [Effrenium voratum]